MNVPAIIGDKGVNMQIKELVAGEVFSVGPEVTMRQAASAMIEARIGSVAVEADGTLLGILTERDVTRAVAEGADVENDPVSEWMTGYPDTFSPDMEVEEAADWMLAADYRHLPVIDRGSMIGMVSIKDVLWALTESEKR